MNTRELIEKYDFKIQKKYGQNFIKDQAILEGIADSAGVGSNDIVLEIGPGLGSLTRELCKKAAFVVAVEIDRMLIPILEEELKEFKNLKVIHGDILKLDIEAILKELINEINHGKHTVGSKDYDKPQISDKVKVVANLPYYITTPIVMELLEDNTIFESITVMVQKEVAERMQQGVGTKAYGALSLAVGYYSRAKIVMHVSKNSFIPKPDVDSAVIKLDIYEDDERPVQTDNKEEMFKIIRAAFNQRRKTLVNALSNAGGLNYSKEDILKAIKGIDKPETIRGEALSLEEFAGLTDILVSAKN